MPNLALAPAPEQSTKPGRLTMRVITIAQLMTPEQLAFYLQQKVGTIYGYVRQAGNKVNPPKHPIPFRKLGGAPNGALRFDFDEIVAWTKKGVE